MPIDRDNNHPQKAKYLCKRDFEYGSSCLLINAFAQTCIVIVPSKTSLCWQLETNDPCWPSSLFSHSLIVGALLPGHSQENLTWLSEKEKKEEKESKKKKNRRRKSFGFEGEESERSHALNMSVVYISMSPSLINTVNF